MRRYKGHKAPAASGSGDNSREFHQHFGQQYLQRYPSLFEALAQPVHHVALVNPFAAGHCCNELHMEPCFSFKGISCYRFPEPPASYPPPPTDHATKLKQLYWMDFASVLPAVLLDVAPHHVVLDMCAAPGGKTLILSQMLLDPHGLHSTANSLAQTHLERQRSQQQIEGEQCSESEEQPQHEQLGGGHAGVVAAEAACASGDEQEQQGTCSQTLQQQTEKHGSMVSEGEQLQQQSPAKESPSKQHSHAEAEACPDRPSSSDSHPSQQQQQQQRSSTSLGRLVANEVDTARRSRLQDVVNQYIPAHYRRRVRVTGRDGTRHWSRFEGEMYDRILLDAPCSSDRHVVAAAVAQGGKVSLGDWSVATCHQLAKLQTQLLVCGLKALKPGGRLVYSTCSISNTQNDAVVQAACEQYMRASNGKAPLKSERCRAEVSPHQELQNGACAEDSGIKVLSADMLGLGDEEMRAWGVEQTQLGMICLPDVAGCGPIYAAVLEKQ